MRWIVRALEAILAVGLGPLSVEQLAQALSVSVDEVHDGLRQLAMDLESGDRGLRLVATNAGYQLETAPDLSFLLAKLMGEPEKLSKAALEVLALVAYMQPVSRAQVSELRGVNSDATMRRLAVMGLIRPVNDANAIPVLYGTTELFLSRFGLSSLSDLPPLSEAVPEVDELEELEARLFDAGR
jgi:segregation and condensation protein B